MEKYLKNRLSFSLGEKHASNSKSWILFGVVFNFVWGFCFGWVWVCFAVVCFVGFSSVFVLFLFSFGWLGLGFFAFFLLGLFFVHFGEVLCWVFRGWLVLVFFVVLCGLWCWVHFFAFSFGIFFLLLVGLVFV